MYMKRVKVIISVFIVLLLVYLVVIKSKKVSSDYQANFRLLNAELKAQQPGAGNGIIDLDALDNNLDTVVKKLGNDFKLRLTAKSLPSIDLLKYLMEKGHTNRLMVFSEPFIAEILTRFDGDSIDMLLGKPLPVEALTRLKAYNGWNNISWLIDTKERLNEYLTFAKRENVKLKLSVEIDVGLHRGGFQTTSELADIIKTLQQNEQYLQLTGLMGYDGHVPHVPFYINKATAIQNVFIQAQQCYTAFVDELKKYYSAGFISTLTFNGGGSKTYFYYPQFKNITPVNEIAMGSGFLAPEEFRELLLLGHKPALYLASPVLKKIETAKLPFAEKLTPLIDLWDPNLKVSYYLMGGGWAGEPVAPAGLKKNPFWDSSDKGIMNLLPNQSLLCSSDQNDLHVGDFVFYYPWEGDGMLAFKQVILVRQNKIIGRWETYRGGN